MSARTDLLAPPQTKDYRPRPPLFSGMMGLAATTSGFLLPHVEEMRRDDQVSMCLAYRGEPLHGAKFDIQASTSRVRSFVDEQIQRFWRKSLATALECLAFGYTGSEALYEDRQGLIHFDALRPLHPLDVRVKLLDGLLHSVVVRRGVAGGTSGYPGLAGPVGEGVELKAATDRVPGKGVWFVHQATYSPWYGRSVLAPAWYPWRLKTMPDGAMEILFKWFYRHAFSGMVIRYPQSVMFSNSPADTPITAQDYAMQIGEQMKAGASVGLPSDSDVNGNPLWKIEQYAKIEGNADGLIAYLEFLNKQIARGCGIPDEVLTQGDAGSYAKAKVTAGAFYRACEQTLNAVTESFERHVLKGLVRLNFGRAATFKVTPLPLQQDAQQQPGQGGGPPPMVPGGVGPDPAGGGMPGMPGMPGMGQAPEAGGDDPLAALLGGGGGGGGEEQGQALDEAFTWGGETEDGTLVDGTGPATQEGGEGGGEDDPLAALLGMGQDGMGDDERWDEEEGGGEDDPLKALLGVRMSRAGRDARSVAQALAARLNAENLPENSQFHDAACEYLSDTPYHVGRNRSGRWVVVGAEALARGLMSQPVQMSHGVPAGWEPYTGKLGKRKGQAGLKHARSGRVVWEGTPEYARMTSGGRKQAAPATGDAAAKQQARAHRAITGAAKKAEAGVAAPWKAVKAALADPSAAGMAEVVKVAEDAARQLSYAIEANAQSRTYAIAPAEVKRLKELLLAFERDLFALQDRENLGAHLWGQQSAKPGAGAAVEPKKPQWMAEQEAAQEEFVRKLKRKNQILARPDGQQAMDLEWTYDYWDDAGARAALDRALGNAGLLDTEGHWAWLDGWDDWKGLAKEAAYAYEDATDDAEIDALETVLRLAGAKPHGGERGEVVPFDGTWHTTDDDVRPGDPVKVVHPGWSLPGAVGPYRIGRGKVVKASGGSGAAKPGAGAALTEKLKEDIGFALEQGKGVFVTGDVQAVKEQFPEVKRVVEVPKDLAGDEYRSFAIDWRNALEDGQGPLVLVGSKGDFDEFLWRNGDLTGRAEHFNVPHAVEGGESEPVAPKGKVAKAASPPPASPSVVDEVYRDATGGDAPLKKAKTPAREKVKPVVGEIKEALASVRSDDVTFWHLDRLADGLNQLSHPEVLAVIDGLGISTAERTKRGAVNEVRMYLRNMKIAADSSKV